MPTNAFVITAAEPTTDDLRAIAKRWWLPALFGAITAVIGLILMFNLFTAVRTLVWVVAIGLFIEGVDEVVNADRYASKTLARVLGLIWIATGIAAVVWPGITLWALAVVTGVGFIVGGIVQSMLAVLGRERIDAWGLWLVLGVLSVLVGIGCLAWPGATVLVLALLLGVKLFVRGIVLLVFGFGLKRLGAELA